MNFCISHSAIQHHCIIKALGGWGGEREKKKRYIFELFARQFSLSFKIPAIRAHFVYIHPYHGGTQILL